MSRSGNTTRITDSLDAQGTDSTEVRSAHGQPRPSGLEIDRMPSAAERTRTLVQGTCSAMLLVPRPDGAQPWQLLPFTRTVGPDGGVFLVLPAGADTVRAAARIRGGEVTGVLELTDVAPVSVPHRIRARARLSGPLTAGPGPAEPGHTTLCLAVREAYVDDLRGAEPVAPEDFAAAVPDPLVEHEAELLQHLHAAHSAEVRTLGRLLGERSEVVSGAGARPCRSGSTASDCGCASPATGASTRASTSPSRCAM